MPLALAILDLERSNRSTRNQDKSAQLSGPEIPGVQISEEGNLLLITIKASTNFPLELDNWGASVIAITEGCSSASRREIS